MISGHNERVARVLLGVTGGIAAYKACELARLLVRAGHEVTPILTPEAEGFVTAKTFEALARREMPTCWSSPRFPRAPWRSSPTASRTTS
jgi:phosphopantothenoylcysteine synthetase/decarboxylase